MKIVDGVKYEILDDKQINDYVYSVAKKEWEEEDFITYGDDLEKSEWRLEKIAVSDIKVNKKLLGKVEFKKDLEKRVKKILKIFKENQAIPPLILRGKDLLVFDGYARLSAFKITGVKYCLAYVGSYGFTQESK